MHKRRFCLLAALICLQAAYLSLSGWKRGEITQIARRIGYKKAGSISASFHDATVVYRIIIVNGIQRCKNMK
ncbi:hypothetical protein [Paenibacillus sp.]|jgi:hypothetical protein|uniref:hypothetical protein n=1 Tax=Paenibacillus sp. TaxID=58172 RepID=UPI00283419F3|nr:hypothetical protein [Paenibacillus sp.]MDR0270429.1 hypothetical protein [Paenibacillus sp.]